MFKENTDGQTHFFGDSCNPPHRCNKCTPDYGGIVCKVCNQEMKDNQIVEWEKEYGGSPVIRWAHIVNKLLSQQDKVSYKRGYENGKLAELEDNVSSQLVPMKETVEKIRKAERGRIRKWVMQQIVTPVTVPHHSPYITGINTVCNDLLDFLK